MKNFSELKTRDLLTKAQMQSVKGGGTCGYKGPVVNGKPTIICNLPKQVALFFFEGSEEGGHWCCDSCASNGGSASYC